MKRVDRPTVKRRGTAVAFVAVSMVMMLSFAALAIDVGHITATRAELQHSADAAALAAASQLGLAESLGPTTVAREMAKQYAGSNKVVNQAPCLEDADVVYGQAVLEGERYRFVPGGAWFDAVRVTIRRTEGSTNGPLPLFFAPIMGKHHTDVAASAAAMLTPRDIAVVADLSASHTDDSELANLGESEINIWAVWEGLAPVGGIVPLPLNATEDLYQQFAGPLFGNMSALGWGTMELDSAYRPSQDAGLAYLPRNYNWTNDRLRQALTSNAYTSAETNAIFAKDGDSSTDRYVNRVAVALGLATWSSGIGGRGNGDGDKYVENSEVTWSSYPHEDGSWKEWIENYVAAKSIATAANGETFRYRFGAKTYVDYLLTSHTGQDTLALSDCPVQPMQSVKDAVQLLTERLADTDGLDLVSLETYDTVARHEVSLTDEYHLVSERLNQLQAGYYGPYTNIGAGIYKGIETLTGPDARPGVKKYMFLLTDGLANVSASGKTGDVNGGKAYTRAAAQAAAAEGIQIFTITVGVGADRSMMEEVAQIGGGITFHAGGSIAEYSAEMKKIFEQLAGTRPVVLIE
jgi:hypothetical protein